MSSLGYKQVNKDNPYFKTSTKIAQRQAAGSTFSGTTTHCKQPPAVVALADPQDFLLCDSSSLSGSLERVTQPPDTATHATTH